MRGQVLAIALVIAGGVAVSVLSLANYTSLITTRAAYYDDYRFADVFVTLKRAPRHLAAVIAGLPGVQAVTARVEASAKLEVPGFDEPVSARLVSLPPEGQPRVNRLFLRQGRLPHPGRSREVAGDPEFRRSSRSDAGRPLCRHHQRAAADPSHHRCGGVAGIHLCDAPRGHVAGLRPLRRIVAESGRPGRRHGHDRCLQQPGGEGGPGGAGGLGHGCHGPFAGPLRRYRVPMVGRIRFPISCWTTSWSSSGPWPRCFPPSSWRWPCFCSTS